jgi:hypothetical protein
MNEAAVPIRTAMQRRARLRWRLSQRVGGGSDSVTNPHHHPIAITGALIANE